MTIGASTSPRFEEKLVHTEKRTEVNNSQNTETTSKVKKVWGAILLVLGALAVVAGIVGLVVPPAGVAIGLAGSALIAVSLSLIGGGFVLGSVGSFLLGRSVQTKRTEVITDESKVVPLYEKDKEDIRV